MGIVWVTGCIVCFYRNPVKPNDLEGQGPPSEQVEGGLPVKVEGRSEILELGSVHEQEGAEK